MSDGYEISDDPARLDVDAIHRWLAGESYWARGRSRETMERAIRGSLCIGAYTSGGDQAGFCRLVTDRATFAWLADVFVLPGHRGHGLGKRLVAAAVEHPDTSGVTQILLGTEDAHGLYRRFGFDDVPPGQWMRLRR